MVTPVVVALSLLAQQPQVEAELDRTFAEVGEDVVLTVSVNAPGSQSVEVMGQPALNGLQLRGSSQTSTLRVDGGMGVRTTVWEYTLRALTPGTATVGPIRVRVGVEELRVDALAVEVHAVDAASREAVDERISTIVDGAPSPDGSDQVLVTVVPSPSNIVLGEQVDLVVVAWFPRDLRNRLRTRPTLTPPELQGAWSYAQTSALGVVATREVQGRLYDLFVHHQVVFPLTAGTLDVGPARVSFSVPLRQSILSREQSREVESEPARVVVAAQPEQNRPASFNGLAASDLNFTVDVDTGGFANGEVATVRAVLTGAGNVALWPEPNIDWPDGVRVYPAGSSIQVDADSGLVRGSKTFTYVLAADSVGQFTIDEPRVPYYDPTRGQYQEVRVESISLTSRIGRDEKVIVGDPLPLMAEVGVQRIDTLIFGLPRWGWALFFGLPIAIALVAHMVARRRTSGSSRSEAPLLERSVLYGPARDFQKALTMLVPEWSTLNRERLAAALEAAGVEIPLAAHAAKVRDRIRQSVYGPPFGIDADELSAEIREVLKALPARAERSGGFVGVATMAMLCALGMNGVQASQTVTAEQLYVAGGYHQAADSFLQRAVLKPNEAAHWQNLGLALHAVGDNPGARAAWLKAARLVPRNQNVRSARQQLTPLDPESQRLTWVSPVTAAEAMAVGAVTWLFGWMVYLFRKRIAAVAILVVAIGSLGYGVFVARAYASPGGLILRPNTSLRAAPYGPAPALRLLGEDTMVRILRRDGAWILVERGESRGWLLATEVARI